MTAQAGAVPSSAEWLADNGQEATMEWRAGWDACRVEYPRDLPRDCLMCGERIESGDGHIGNTCPLTDPDPDELLTQATPPAAVPVEALEGLVARIEREASAHDYFAENRDLRMTTGDHAKRKTSLFAIADELTQLIKERSNG